MAARATQNGNSSHADRYGGTRPSFLPYQGGGSLHPGSLLADTEPREEERVWMKDLRMLSSAGPVPSPWSQQDPWEVRPPSLA